MRIARLVAAASAAAALAVFTTGAPALAHNSLTKAVPAKNATLTRSPDAIELSFLQAVDAKQLTIEVADAKGAAVAAGKPVAKGKVGSLALTSPLTGGTYTVTYRVVSTDGHPVKGSYKFTLDLPAVAAPLPSLSPTSTTVVTSAAPATLAASTTTDDGPNWALIIGIAAALAVITAGTIFALRRSKSL